LIFIIPKFLSGPEATDEIGDIPNSATPYFPNEEPSPHTGIEEVDHGINSRSNDGAGFHPSAEVERYRTPTSGFFGARRRRLVWLPLAAAVLIVIVVVAVSARRKNSLISQTAVDDFWAPMLHDDRSVLVCTGGVVFAPQNFSGVVTASKDSDYPFVSMQNASAIAQIGGKLGRWGATTQLVFAGSEPLTELREHSVTLIGGYNNQWTMRMLRPLRFYFPPEPIEAIMDRQQPQARWSRDKSVPYSSGDDFAIVARFRDSTIDGWVVVVAGLGRNGTEAAAQFATSPHYVQLLREQVPDGLSNRNIEVVLKVPVIDGKTGAPSILAVQVW
jgi:hypothetical protein